MQLIDLGMFLVIFIIFYLLGAGFVKIIHLIRKDKSKNYRIGVLIFALLVAAMITYNNLGRWDGRYADPAQLFQLQEEN
ncbi:hypothetical protein IPM44_03805 [bacterium]|jgi:hypothetical protein|nr:MAG: hypothetical protein IPM44_03805 [bacterium]